MEWVIAEDVYAEAWRRLMEYSNLDLTMDQIVKFHGEPKNSSEKSNYKKQARQVRLSLLQAKEYFEAAASSSLYTSANHLYYGCISLASAVMLIRGDGQVSLDILRRDGANCHHGLMFTTGCTEKEASNGLSLLKNSFSEVLARGHFSNWYVTMPPYELHPAYMTRHYKGGGHRMSREIIGRQSLSSINEMSGRKKSLFDLLVYLPDLAFDLNRYGVVANICRMTHTVSVAVNGDSFHSWSIHGMLCHGDFDSIAGQFKIPPTLYESFGYDLNDHGLGGVVTLEVPATYSDDIQFAWPCSRESLDHDTISYGAEFDTSEFVDGYMASYQLSMLSRYFPDVWIACLESQCRAAKLVERSVEVLRRKMPILALSSMGPRPVTISNHRQPWREF